MKIIFDNKEQMERLCDTAFCSDEIFDGAPGYFHGCTRDEVDGCINCLSKYIEMEVKTNE